MKKTNVMRFLDSMNILHEEYEYDGKITNGEEVANVLNENPNQVFKTLVTQANNKNYYVFCIPVNKKLNLKKAASIAKCKSLEMIKQKDLLKTTGYIHGGCSPLKMIKQFETFIDESSLNYDKIFISAGKVGYQISISLDELKKVLDFKLSDLVD